MCIYTDACISISHVYTQKEGGKMSAVARPRLFFARCSLFVSLTFAVHLEIFTVGRAQVEKTQHSQTSH